MIHIDGRLYAQLYIEDREFPLGKTGFGFIQVNTNVNFFLPMGRIQINDDRRLFQDHFTLGDYTKITLYLGVSPDKKEQLRYDFRLFQYSATQRERIMVYTLDLIYDMPKYFNQLTTTSITSTSTEAIKRIAADCGFKTIITSPTSDSQTWLPFNSKNCMFARNIAQSGYVDDRSMMVLCVDSRGQLKYQNLSNIKFTENDKKFVLSNGNAQTSFSVMARKELSKSGLMNNLYGYKFSTLEQNPVQGGTTQHSGVQVRATGKSLNLNAAMNKQDIPRIAVTPLGGGNVHANYSKAKHQNTRLKAFQSSAVHVAVNNVTKIELLDPVIYYSLDTTGLKGAALSKVASGNYLVTAKSVYATGNGWYYEKFEIVHSGSNFDPDKKQTQMGVSNA